MAKKGYIRKKNQPILNTIGTNIRRYRILKELSVEKLAILANIEAKSIYNYEYSKVDIGASSVAVIANALQIEPYLLLMPMETEEH